MSLQRKNISSSNVKKEIVHPLRKQNINELQKVNYYKVAATSVISGGIIFIISLIMDMVRVHSVNKKKITFAPNLEATCYELAHIYQQFISVFYSLCPNEYKDLYKKYITTSIHYAEATAIIMNQLLNREIKKLDNERIYARTYANISISYLRKVIPLFENNNNLDTIIEKTDIITLLLCDILNNINILYESNMML